jgi:hypothetical protein
MTELEFGTEEMEVRFPHSDAMPARLPVVFDQVRGVDVGVGVGVAVGVAVGVGVGVGVDAASDAEQLAVVPPLEPPQLHVHGPGPARDDAVPAEQRPAEGLDDAVVPFADPHTPLTGAGPAFTATVVLAAGEVPPLPVHVSV